MHRHIRSLLALLVIAVAAVACSTSDMPVTPKLSPGVGSPTFAKINATDSNMVVTDIAYGDTAFVLKRLSPLAADITTSATIGSSGGSLKIDAAGIKVDIPSGALSTPTVITMTAKAGLNVAYEFGPHGTTFAEPVKIQQDLKVTVAGTNAAVQRGLHGAYYEGSLDSAYTDPLKLTAKIKENQLGYKDATGSQLRFFVNHFSGYMLSSGFREF